MSQSVLGTVSWFQNAKGYGFIKTEDDVDVFVHFSAIKAEGYKSLNEGDKVRLEILETEKGKQAQNVEVIEAAPGEKNKKFKKN